MYLQRQTKDLWNNSRPSSKRNRVFITSVIRPPVAPTLIARPSTALSTPQPIHHLHRSRPELTTPQILLPDPPPELTTSQILLPDPPPSPITPELMTPQILLPDPPPVKTTPQILLPDRPPVVEEPTLMDAFSMDQIMASVFGDYTPQGIPPAHTQEPQVLDTVPSLFDESNGLISFLDHFQTGLAIEQQEAPWTRPCPE
ncbi:hypothetical protein TNCV_1528501 [Trichonephila clavipes]|nr:hypothetical protein TNCV_1528501 [Trichonephila clavipes]